MLRTREFTDSFMTFDEIYLVFTSKSQYPLYLCDISQNIFVIFTERINSAIEQLFCYSQNLFVGVITQKLVLACISFLSKNILIKHDRNDCCRACFGQTYNRTSMTRTPLGRLKLVRDRGSSS